MGNLNEKQQSLVIFGASAVLALIFLSLFYMDYQSVHAYEDPADTPEPAEGEDPELMKGLIRRAADLDQRIQVERAEAEKLAEREEQVVVYREILERDSQILPDSEDVNRLGAKVREFEIQSGVSISSVSKLEAPRSKQAVTALPISLKLSGSFDEVLKFLSLFENYDRLVNTRQFSISAGEVYGEGPNLRAIHNVNLDLETYVYAKGAGITNPVTITNYDAIKARAEVQKAIRDKEGTAIERYALAPRPGRRDPLISVRVPVVEVSAEEEQDRSDQETIVSDLADQVKILSLDLEQHAKLVEQGDIVRAATLKKLILGKITKLDQDLADARDKVSLPDLRRRLVDEVERPFKDMMEAVGGDGDGPREYPAASVRKFHLKMQVAFEQQDYRDVISIMDAFRLDVGDNPVAPAAQRTVAEMNGLAHQAGTHMDFEKLSLRCTGVIVNPGNTGDSRTIVDGRPVGVDDYVDEDKVCRLVEIRADRLLFEFKGERIWLERIR